MKQKRRAEGGRAEGGRAEGGRAEGGRAEGGRAEGGRAEGGRAEGGGAEGGGFNIDCPSSGTVSYCFEEEVASANHRSTLILLLLFYCQNSFYGNLTV